MSLVSCKQTIPLALSMVRDIFTELPVFLLSDTLKCYLFSVFYDYVTVKSQSGTPSQTKVLIKKTKSLIWSPSEDDL